MGAAEIVVEGQILERGENGGDGPLGGGDGVDAAGVAEGDVAGKDFEEGVDAGEGGLDDADAAQEGPGALGLGGERRRDPEFDVEGMVKARRDEDEVDAGGEQASQIGIDGIGEADFQHGGLRSHGDRLMLTRRGQAKSAKDMRRGHFIAPTGKDPQGLL